MCYITFCTFLRVKIKKHASKVARSAFPCLHLSLRVCAKFVKSPLQIFSHTQHTDADTTRAGSAFKRAAPLALLCSPFCFPRGGSFSLFS